MHALVPNRLPGRGYAIQDASVMTAVELRTKRQTVLALPENSDRPVVKARRLGATVRWERIMQVRTGITARDNTRKADMFVVNFRGAMFCQTCWLQNPSASKRN